MNERFIWRGPSATAPLNVRVPIEYRAALTSIAHSMGGTLSWLTREAIQDFLERHPGVDEDQAAELRRIHQQIRPARQQSSTGRHSTHGEA